MRNRRLLGALLACSATLISLTAAKPCAAQAPLSGDVTMTLLKVVKQKGKKYLQTQTGELLPISGDNIAKDAAAVAIYRDSSANYWYVNKEGQPTAIPPEKVHWAVQTIEAQRELKQAGVPNPELASQGAQSTSQAPVQQTTIVQSPNNGSGGGSTAAAMLGTGAMAMTGGMLGGMLGAAISDDNHWCGVPYGAPMYHEGNRGYYNNNGSKVYVNNEHNQALMDQWNHQGQWQNRNNWQNQMQHAEPSSQPLQSSHHERSFRRQEGWGGFRRGRR